MSTDSGDNAALGGAVGGAVQGVFGLIGSGIQAAQASQQYKYTKRLQESAHYWGRERDRQRFKDIRKGLERAGLNPVLAASGAFGGGGGGMPGTGSVGLPQQPQLGGVVSTALQVGRYKKEMRLLDEQIAATKAEAWRRTMSGTKDYFDTQHWWGRENLYRSQAMESDERRRLLHEQAGITAKQQAEARAGEKLYKDEGIGTALKAWEKFSRGAGRLWPRVR